MAVVVVGGCLVVWPVVIWWWLVVIWWWLVVAWFVSCGGLVVVGGKGWVVVVGVFMMLGHHHIHPCI